MQHRIPDGRSGWRIWSADTFRRVPTPSRYRPRRPGFIAFRHLANPKRVVCYHLGRTDKYGPGERRMAEQEWLNGSAPGGEPYSGGLRNPPPTVRHELRPLTTGEILDRTFFLYRSNFWLYAGLASIAAGVNVLTSISRLTFIHFARMPATSPKT